VHELETADFYCAVFLRASGCKLLKVFKLRPSADFVFTFQSKSPTLIEDYAAGAPCSAIALAYAVGALKRAMSSANAGQGVRS